MPNLCILIICYLITIGCIAKNENNSKSQLNLKPRHSSSKQQATSTTNLLYNTIVADNSNLSLGDNYQQKFKKWVANYKKHYIMKYGFDQRILSYLDSLKLNTRVLDLDKSQAEFSLDFWTYYGNSVTQKRIKEGKYKLAYLGRTFDRAQKKYGVDKHILVAFWGMETNYGSYMGSNLVLESLASLAFEGRREKFFTKELTNALIIIKKNRLDAYKLKGSWAGAIGNFQFMPSNYLKYGYDASGNSKIDLINEPIDAIFSAANFLNKLGWNKSYSWGVEVSLPKNFDFNNFNKKLMLAKWLQLGIKARHKKYLPHNKKIKANLLLPHGYKGPAFLVFDNFKVIKRWNNSSLYAIAVGRLADRIRGFPKLKAAKPKNHKKLSRINIIATQTRLKNLGYKIGKIDGILGSKTRQAIMNFQKNNGLIADGFLSNDLVKMLKSTKKLFGKQI